MFDTMYAARRESGSPRRRWGAPSASPWWTWTRTRLVLINPEIIEREGRAKGEEGCLSIPDVYGDVDAPRRVIVRALDEEGEPFEIEATELLARCMQHEIDHLDGKLFIDYLSVLKRTLGAGEVEARGKEVSGLHPPGALETSEDRASTAPEEEL